MPGFWVPSSLEKGVLRCSVLSVSSWDTEQAIEELRKLVGHGAKPHRLPTKPALRAALGVPVGISFFRASLKMDERLRAAVRAVRDGTYTVLKKPVPGLQVRLALQVSLEYDQEGDDAKTRRTAAMHHLRVWQSVETWRRDKGGEVELLAILAQSLAMRDAATQTPNRQIKTK